MIKVGKLKAARALIVGRARGRKVQVKPFDTLLITCEHGGNLIPERYKKLFRGEKAVLETHRGLDIGALKVARMIAKKLDAPLFYSTTSRLLIDLNRSLHNKGLFSTFTAELSDEERDAIARRYYTPYRQNVEAWISSQTRLGKRVLHVSVHSFTPKMDGEVRNAEIGYLYDPQRRAEGAMADKLDKLTRPAAKLEGWRIRRNYPYQGSADGFTTHLREQFEVSRYMGLEIEMNQKVVGDAEGQRKMALLFSKALLDLR